MKTYSSVTSPSVSVHILWYSYYYYYLYSYTRYTYRTNNTEIDGTVQQILKITGE